MDADGSSARGAVLLLALGVALEGQATALAEALTMELEGALLPPGGSGALFGHPGLYGVGLVGRLLGAPVAGALGDRWGAARAAQASVAALGAGLLLLGLLPGYGSAGGLSRLGFGAIWFLQSAAVSGQLVISSLLAIDLAPEGCRGLASGALLGSWALGSLGGGAGALALRSTVGSAALAQGAWRIPFVAGAVLCAAVALGQRCAVPPGDPREPEKPEGAWRHVRSPPQRDLQVRSAFAGAVLISAAWAAPFAVAFRWLPGLLSEQASAPSTAPGGTQAALLGLLAVLLPLAGHCSSSKGSAAVLAVGQGSLLLWPPLLWCVGHLHSTALSAACLVVFAASLGLLGGPLFSWLWEFAPVLGSRRRLVVAWASAGALAGPTARAAALLAAHGGPFAAGLVCAAFGMAGLRSLLAGWRKVVEHRELEAWRDDALGDIRPLAIVVGHRDEEVSEDIEAELEEELVELSHGLKLGGSPELARRWGGQASGGAAPDESEEIPLFADRHRGNGSPQRAAGDASPAGL